ncbi:hypothetical protein HYC85_019449 [Camellia sinensis]|uniref:Glutathione S-transferase n=1 Tax=Camellia sinensis TaxID=4442 RepID=A0A7J7GMT1_CAMSI|nr:hypothetical protein HYC85_019449 [Camellia sinensis]
MEEVKLHGCWASPYSCKVIWALKLKGVKYEYIEEDLSTRVNCCYKTWPENPLLPEDVYERAMARFWINFGEQKGLIFYDFIRSTRETQEKATKQVLEVLKTIEEQGLGDKKFFGGNTLGLVDLSFGWLVQWFEVMEEVILGTSNPTLLDPTTLPRLYAWVQNLKGVPVIKENLPNREKLSARLKRVRDIIVAGHDE